MSAHRTKTAGAGKREAAKAKAAELKHKAAAEVKRIGNEITVRLGKMKQAQSAIKEKAERDVKDFVDQADAVAKLLADARKQCKAAGLKFEAFRKTYAPDFGRTKVYDLLRIGSGVLSLADHRELRKNKKREERASKKASATTTVADTLPAPRITGNTEPGDGIEARRQAYGAHGSLIAAIADKLVKGEEVPDADPDDVDEARELLIKRREAMTSGGESSPEGMEALGKDESPPTVPPEPKPEYPVAVFKAAVRVLQEKLTDPEGLSPEEVSDDALTCVKAALSLCTLMNESDLKQARIYFMEQKWKPRTTRKAEAA